MGFFIWYDMVKELQKYHTYKHLITSFKLVNRNTAHQQKSELDFTKKYHNTC